MRKIDMTDQLWARLLAMRGAGSGVSDEADPVMALYAPIAAAKDGFVLAQVGQSLDGRVATPSGDARDISGPDGIAHLHRCRALVEAVIVGVGTVKCDDPRLSVRAVKGPNPVRVVIDCGAELTGEERLFRDGGAPVILIQADDAPVKSYGADVIRVRKGEGGLDPQEILDALAARGLRRILVEGGARTIARFIEAGLVDRLHVAIAPLIIGSGPAGIALPPIEKLSSAHRPAAKVYTLGSDVLFDCDLSSAAGSAAGQGEDIRVADHA
ncbi:RibD family protein [Rhizobium rosettiformans]|uniref:RibD family protein n=1 Tax=Rhizobium rosettiformans TaxID=1368430 RepID=UPI002865DA55|nr:RibD family protein [Rhizobium rosettiformans]MDR7028499.1 riboflavin-specific deaminase-like protein [Rhizobium rosettiformans]MDR7064219.1 riboflavin-specific deaminase-like protein [Rhizobium rosettiformans]